MEFIVKKKIKRLYWLNACLSSINFMIKYLNHSNYLGEDGKNVTSNIEQVLAATSHKEPTI